MTCLNLQRNSKIFLSTVSLAEGEAVSNMTPMNTWELGVLTGYALSENSNYNELSRSEIGETPTRTVTKSTDRTNPVNWNFQNYIRPTLAQIPHYANSTFAYTSNSGKAKPLADWFMWQALVSNTNIASTPPGGTVNFEDSVWYDKGSLTTANHISGIGVASSRSSIAAAQENHLYFKTDNLVYQISNAAVGSAAVDAGIEELATVTWSGLGTNLVELESSNRDNAISVFGGVLSNGSSVTANSSSANLYAVSSYHPHNQMNVAGEITTNSYIKNRLSLIEFSLNSNTYTFPVTTVSLNYNNKINYLSQNELGTITQPVGQHVTDRSVGGSATMYLRGEGSAKFMKEIKDAGLSYTSNAILYVGDSVKFTMPKVHFDTPNISAENIFTVGLNFTAQESEYKLSDELAIEVITDANDLYNLSDDSETVLALDYANDYYYNNGRKDLRDITVSSTTGLKPTWLSNSTIGWPGHNYVEDSEDFTGAWTNEAVTATSDAIDAPISGYMADHITEDVTSAQHRIYMQSTCIIGDHTWAVFAKAGARKWLGIRSAGATIAANFDLENGVVGTTDNCTTNMTALGNGWYYCEMFGTAVATDFITFNIGDADTGIANSYVYQGDGSSGLYLFGAHFYRSDYGGMVTNTDNSNYYRTTGSAYFAPCTAYDLNAYGDGTELVLNGSLDTSDDWVFGGVWSWNSNGYAEKTGLAGGNSDLAQNPVRTPNTPTIVTFTVSEYSGGTVNVRINGVDQTARTANGTYTEIVRDAGTDLVIRASGDFLGRVDNISAQELGAFTYGGELVAGGEFIDDTSDWTTDKAILTITDGILEIERSTASSGAWGLAYQIVTTEIGKTYTVLVRGKDGTHGGRIMGGEAVGTAEHFNQEFTADYATYEHSFIATTTTTYLTLWVTNSTPGATSYFDFVRMEGHIHNINRIGQVQEPALNRLNYYPVAIDGTGWADFSGSTSTNLALNVFGIFDGVAVGSGGGTVDRLREDTGPSLIDGVTYPFEVYYREGTSNLFWLYIDDKANGTASGLRGTPGSLSIYTEAAGTFSDITETLLSDGLTYRLSGYFTKVTTGNTVFGFSPLSNVIGETVIALGVFIGGANEEMPYCPLIHNVSAGIDVPADITSMGPVVSEIELITDGDMSDDTNWSEGTSWNIINGKATYDGVAAGFLTQASVGDSRSKTYSVTVEITNSVGATGSQNVTRLMIGGGVKAAITADELAAEGPVIIREVIDGDSGAGLSIEGTLGRSFDIDNISIQELVPFVGYNDDAGTWVFKGTWHDTGNWTGIIEADGVDFIAQSTGNRLSTADGSFIDYTTDYTNNTPNAVVMSYEDLGLVNILANGGSAGEFTNAVTGTFAQSLIWIGHWSESNVLHGVIHEIRYYNTQASLAARQAVDLSS